MVDDSATLPSFFFLIKVAKILELSAPLVRVNLEWRAGIFFCLLDEQYKIDVCFILQKHSRCEEWRMIKHICSCICILVFVLFVNVHTYSFCFTWFLNGLISVQFCYFRTSGKIENPWSCVVYSDLPYIRFL